MKRLSKIITMLLVVFLVTGCVRRKINMNISRNGEIELTAIIAYADSANMTVSESDKAKYKSNGFKVEDYNQDEYKGVKISKKFKISEVSSDSEVKFSLKDLEETAKPIMFQKIGNKKYKANFVLDTRTSDGQSGSGVDISYTVTLPNKPISHNANSVDGNTLTWTADLGEEKAINYEFSLGGISTSLIIIGIIVVAAVAIVIVVIVMGKKNKQNPNMSSFGNEVPVVPEVDVPVTPTVPITYNDIKDFKYPNQKLGVIAHIENANGEILLQQRGIKSRDENGFYKHIGGKVEKEDKSFKEAIIRETKEEAGTEVNLQYSNSIGIYHCFKNNINWIFIIYLAKYLNGKIKVIEKNKCEGYKIKCEDLKTLEFSREKTIENGIALSYYGHGYFHYIEEFAPDIYFQLNKILLLLAKERRLPTLEERCVIQILFEAFEYCMENYRKIPAQFLIRERNF